MISGIETRFNPLLFSFFCIRGYIFSPFSLHSPPCTFYSFNPLSSFSPTSINIFSTGARGLFHYFSINLYAHSRIICCQKICTYAVCRKIVRLKARDNGPKLNLSFSACSNKQMEPGSGRINGDDREGEKLVERKLLKHTLQCDLCFHCKHPCNV